MNTAPDAPASASRSRTTWPSLEHWLPWLVLAVSLLITWQLWQDAKQNAVQELQSNFNFRVREADTLVEQRMMTYGQVLRGVAGLFASSKSVGRGEFRDFVSTLHLEKNFPGIQGVSFALAVPAAGKNKHIAAVRREGFPEYTIKPEGEREIYAPVVYIEPFSGLNLRVPGFDNYSNPERRAIVNMARDSGDAVITDKIKLMQETDKNIQAGCLMFMPAYKNGLPHDNLAERRASIFGWVAFSFRMDDLMNGILGERSSDIDIEIYDGQEMSEQTLMYDDDSIRRTGVTLKSRFHATNRVEIAGHFWTMEVSSLPGFDARLDTGKSRFIGYAGIGTGILLALLTWLLVRGRTQALQLVVQARESRAMTENSPDTIARYDRDCRRIYVNPALGAMADGGVAAFLGKKPSENPGGQNYKDYETAVKEVFATGKNTQFELRWLDKDGKEIYSHIRMTPERDLSGAITSVLAVGRDITERRLAERRLSDLLAFNQTILNKSPYGIVVFKAEGPCVMANEAYVRSVGGETIERVLAQNFRDISSWKRYGILDLANEALETGLPTKGDVEGTTTFGKDVFLECTFAPISISGMAHLIVIVHDIMDRVKAERALSESIHQLEAKELAKTRFLAAAGHDLRQPLAAANLFIDALKFTEPSADQNKIIRRLDQAMVTFNGLLEALLNISKLDAGIIKPEYASINVVEIINWLEQSFAPMINEKQLGFKLHFPMKESLVICSDFDLIKSALMNLVSNAIKYTSKGAILISARRRGSDVLFQVWDTGIGIQGEHIEHIFDEFYQVNNPQRDRTGGLGLGLAIAKRAISLLGGKITCRSRIGRGSVFEFRLPLADSQSEATHQVGTTEVPQENASQRAFARGKRFIVVEDDKLVAQAMINLLEIMGGEVLCFHNAEDALRHTNIADADYYIADYMLGSTLNGIQFLNQLHQKLGRPINAVLMTGDTSPSFIREAADCDWPVLHKPVNMSTLISGLSAQAQPLK